MYYKDLIITHRAFWNLERRAKAYDNYMKQVKDWRKWPQSVDLFEIEKLLKFIPKWDRWFRMKDPVNVFKVYQRIQPIIVEANNLRLETAILNEGLLDKICFIFNELAPCSGEAYESTDCSKILHTMLPNLIVMWDIEIRKGVLGNEKRKRRFIFRLWKSDRQKREKGS